MESNLIAVQVFANEVSRNNMVICTEEILQKRFDMCLSLKFHSIWVIAYAVDDLAEVVESHVI